MVQTGVIYKVTKDEKRKNLNTSGKNPHVTTEYIVVHEDNTDYYTIIHLGPLKLQNPLCKDNMNKTTLENAEWLEKDSNISEQNRKKLLDPKENPNVF